MLVFLIFLEWTASLVDVHRSDMTFLSFGMPDCYRQDNRTEQLWPDVVQWYDEYRNPYFCFGHSSGFQFLGDILYIQELCPYLLILNNFIYTLNFLLC
jgi:hypothetical protein